MLLDGSSWNGTEWSWWSWTVRWEGGGVGGKALLDVDGDVGKEAMKGDGDIALVTEGLVAGLAVGLVHGTLPLEHVVLPVGRGEVSVARPFVFAPGIRSSRSLDGGIGAHAVEFIPHRGHLDMAEGAWEKGG